MAEPTLHEKRPDAEVVEYVDAEAIGDAPWTNAGTHTDDVRDVLASLDRDPQRVYRVAVDLYVVDRRGDLVALPRPEWRYDADAREWSAAHDLATAWRDCRDARWMLNAVADVVPRQSLVLAACACARTVLHLVPAGETRPLRAIEVAEAWCRGEATLDEVRAAADAAWVAASAAARGAAADAAWVAAWAAADAAAAAVAAASAATRVQHLAALADVVRGVIPTAAVVAALREALP